MKRASNTTRQSILDVAERLFAERGYSAVKLQEIAKGVEMRHASLYYYAPEGKQQLYVEVMERNFQRHRDGLVDAIIRAGDDLRAQLHAVAEWFALQPPINLGQIVHSDLQAISKLQANRLMALSLDSLRHPIASAMRRAQDRGLIQIRDENFAAMGLVALLQSVHNIPADYAPTPAARVALAKTMADMMLDGLLKR
jgi:AcrR family transcriptional regulator